MALDVFVVHGSHPCLTVLQALELKGIPHRVIELPPPLHAPVQRLLFGRRTVPGIRLDSGEKVVGSRAILRRLDALVPEPALLPAGGEARTGVLRAEEWGDQVLQPIARRLVWPALARRPDALASFLEGSRLPRIPGPVLRLLAPGLIAVERRMNGATPDAVRADLRSLPGHLDRVDGWLADGVLGGEQPNAADLQIAPSLRLLMAIGDVRKLIEPRPAGAYALRRVPHAGGAIPAGAYPADWLHPAP
jgi:glutathione S-transferase